MNLTGCGRSPRQGHFLLLNYVKQNRLPGSYITHDIPVVPLDQISQRFYVNTGLQEPDRTITNQHEELLAQCAEHLLRVFGIEFQAAGFCPDFR